MSDTIEQQFRDTAKGNAARAAVSDGETTLRYGEILAAADRGAQRLSQAGLKDSEPVVVPVSNIAADIGAFLTDEPVSATPPSKGYKFRKFARRNKAAFRVVAAALEQSRQTLGGDARRLADEAASRVLGRAL